LAALALALLPTQPAHELTGSVRVVRPQRGLAQNRGIPRCLEPHSQPRRPYPNGRRAAPSGKRCARKLDGEPVRSLAPQERSRAIFDLSRAGQGLGSARHPSLAPSGGRRGFGRDRRP